MFEEALLLRHFAFDLCHLGHGWRFEQTGADILVGGVVKELDGLDLSGSRSARRSREPHDGSLSLVLRHA